MSVRSVFARLFRRRKLDDELREEMELHVEMRAELHRASGMSAEDAHLAARRQFGNLALIQEETRRVYISVFWEGLRQDVRYAIRSFVRAPGFTFTVIWALALGIGSTTAVFSVVDRILFRSLPYANEDRLVSVGVTAPLDANEFLQAADYRDWKAADTPFESLGSFVIGGTPGGAGCDLTDGEPIRLSCALVDSTFLPTFGVEPLIGRNFSADQDQPNVARVALISYALWQSRFGSDPAVVGRSISLDTRPVTVIGVLPRSFEMPTLGQDDILLPQALDPASIVHPQPGVSLRVFGRLKPGVSIPQATAAMDRLFKASLQWIPPAFRNEVKLRIRSVRDRQIQDARTASWILFGAVLTVLMVACANVTNLLLSRGVSRAREFAMRAALGAARGRLTRQMLTESLLLSMVAAIAGWAVAAGLLRGFTATAPAGIPRLAQASLDGRVLVFTLLTSFISATLFSLAPSFQAQPSRTARAEGLGAAFGLRHALVSMQIAASLILLLVASLLIQTLWNLQQVPLGMRTENVVVGSMTLGQRYSGNASRLAFYREAESRIRAIPAQSSYAISDTAPLLPGGNAFRLFAGIEVAGQPRFTEGTGGNVSMRSVTENYFATLGIPILRGRAFQPEDRAANPNVIIISDVLARRLFANKDPLGKQMRWNGDDPWRTVVGVVGSVKNNPVLSGSDDPELYVPFSQFPSRRVTVVMRADGSSARIAESLRSALKAVDPALPVDIQTFSQHLRKLSDRPRFTAKLMGFFSFVAVVLAAVGLFGTISFLVVRRTQEIGLRVALGATSKDIVALVLSQTMRWTALGIVLGSTGSIFIVRTLQNLLFHVSPNDPFTFAFTILVLATTAILAAWIPSRRASHIDPVKALRQE